MEVRGALTAVRLLHVTAEGLWLQNSLEDTAGPPEVRPAEQRSRGTRAPGGMEQWPPPPAHPELSSCFCLPSKAMLAEIWDFCAKGLQKPSGFCRSDELFPNSFLPTAGLSDVLTILHCTNCWGEPQAGGRQSSIHSPSPKGPERRGGLRTDNTLASLSSGPVQSNCCCQGRGRGEKAPRLILIRTKTAAGDATPYLYVFPILHN